MSDGQLLPMAWNILEAVKANPAAMKFHETICRYVLPTATTAASLVNNRTRASALQKQSTVSTTMTAELIQAAERNVSLTRSRCPAPKFWPATGAAAKSMAIA